jgi:hypothetical protein
MAEVMVAMLFLSIAMFGYVALHMRIIHSSTTLRQRHEVRRRVDLYSANLLSTWQQGSLPADGTYPLYDKTLGDMEMITPYLVGSDAPGQAEGTYTVKRILDPPEVIHIATQVEWQSQHGTQVYQWDTYRAAKDKGW